MKILAAFQLKGRSLRVIQEWTHMRIAAQLLERVPMNHLYEKCFSKLVVHD